MSKGLVAGLVLAGAAGLALAAVVLVSLCEAFSGNVAGCWPHL